MTAVSSCLVDFYRGLICDLDGVVYRGSSAVPYAIDVLFEAQRRGAGVVYATNNASRPPREVADQLRALGLVLEERAVVTSAQAGAEYLARSLPAGSNVLALGGPGVAQALSAVGLRAVSSADSSGGEKVSAVLQGYGRDVSWMDLAEAAYAISEGALWVASNTDLTIPTARGLAPGNGSLVGAVRQAVNIDPVVVGKPQTALYELSASVLDGELTEVLALGDRLDTDIEGANKAGIDSLFVLTGVNNVTDVAMSPAILRPRYVASDLRALLAPYVEPTVNSDGKTVTARCADAEVIVGTRRVENLAGEPEAAMRAFVSAAWMAQDAGILRDQDEIRRAAGAVQDAAQRAAQD